MMSNTTPSDSAMVPLDTLTFPLWGSRLIEASAGTGKTYTIASLYVRLVLGHGAESGQRALTPPEILVMTFTRAATAELRDRIRARLTEAAACFLEEVEGDDFLLRLRDDYDPQRWPSCARQLQIAAEWMDDAAVSTIDAWCYRVLREHAFDSASWFNVEMDVDAAETVAEATRDYWRVHIAALSPEAFSQVCEVFGSCDRLAATLHHRWLHRVSRLESVRDPAELLEEVKQNLLAAKRPWAVWADEIRQILTDAYDGEHYHRSKLYKNHWEGWVNKLHAWAHDPESHLPFDSSQKGWERLTPQGLAEVWKNPDEVPLHPGFADMVTLRERLLQLGATLERLYAHAALWVAERTAELRRQRAMLDYNGLLEQLDAALQGPNGTRLAQLIRKQFPAALIDEFQDTSPVQYRIFDRIYTVEQNAPDMLLALIGDPKQAIYAFRGADIHSYLQARQACEGRIYTLGNNFRSTADMVAAVNHVFSWAEQYKAGGAFLFRREEGEGGVRNPVPFYPVRAARNPGQFVVEGQAQVALTIWCEPRAEVTANDIAAACASEIVRLLQLGQKGRAGFQMSGGFEPLRARDIAILVNTHTQAASLGTALRQRGVRSVYLSEKSSVYSSVAAGQLLAWLRACAEPENGAHVRAALATAALGLSWHTLDALVHDEIRWEGMLERFAAYKEEWRTRGVLPMLRRFMHEFGVPARLFRQQDREGSEGERQLTDLLHLAELLQAASTTLDGEHALIRFLEEQMANGGEADADEDVSRLRLESDAGLVQIVTVHKSKGLEYPLVFYPFGHYSRTSGSLELPVTWHGEDGTAHVLAARADADPDTLDRIEALLEQERLAEDMRKLYVALTRARHACWMGVAAGKMLETSAMGHVLGPQACQPETLELGLAALAKGCGAIMVEPLPEPLDEAYRPEGGEVATAPVWRTMGRRIEQGWTLSSYSSLTRVAMARVHERADLVRDRARLALPDEPQLDNFLESYATDDAELGGDSWTGPSARPASAGEGLHGFPKGPSAGSFLHELLEWMFREGPQRVLNDGRALRSHVMRRCQSRGWGEHADDVMQWLQTFFTQRFQPGPEAGEITLSEIPTFLPEMEFWFGIHDVSLPALDTLVSTHFLPGEPRARMAHGRLRGLLRGFVDLVFEHEGRYYVADYKSNWLGRSDDAYTPGAMRQSILEHRYDLQLALYLFALHRLLRFRLGERYDYDRHVGGALVFFMRGCGAPSRGLHVERPPREVLEQMDVLFDGSETGHVAEIADQAGDVGSCS
ncbi:MAG TPA: exodeoxyribonuclease V subunit beta [Burkholderiaceae bacterium]|nr:exodeoxyribonuclease V subunit beta [Burkholderiaceae bacterium]